MIAERHLQAVENEIKLPLMWTLIIRSSSGQPKEYILKPGRNVVGRNPDTGVFVPDRSASRAHAEITYDPQTEVVTLRDLDSTNGTYLNRERLTEQRTLRPNDVVRIGEHVISVVYRSDNKSTSPFAGTRELTRDVLLESLDQHAVLMYEVARQLNTVLDMETALRDISKLMQTSMGADKCEVILAAQFDHLHELGFPTTIAQTVINQKATVVIPEMPAEAEAGMGQSAMLLRVRSVLCVPVISGPELLGLIYMYKTSPEARPFDQRDLQLAVAISHQAALTIQRAQYMQYVQKEQSIRQFLQRFLSPPEAEFLVQDYVHTGHLPGLTEQRLTVLFADLKDSTRLAERAGARRFGEILSRYYQDVTETIFKHGGLLDKYMGDGVMAVFGMTGSEDEPEARAVRAGLDVLDRLDAINQSQTEQIEIGVAINTGLVMAGYVGTTERVEFTVLGDPVNVAYRLESHARPNRLFIGPATTAAVAGQFNLRRLGPVEAKGRTKPIQVHEVLRE
ncbi:MAG: FHA domain-containing protein [Chloroflexi bacterium]|nr:FHA domain-containing protein [Chloroflexota bacterium]